MNAPLRRGQCPTLAAPMQTGDGLLARLNPIASGLSPKALIGLSEAALRHGNGIVEVTARGSFQIRGLTAKSAGLLAAEVDAMGIVVRVGVPVETGPLAGLDPHEIADPRLLAERIRAAIAAGGLVGRLGPKVSVVVDGGGHSGMDAVSADVRLTADHVDANVLWRIGIAGNAATAQPLGSFTEETACEVALAILEAVAALGRQGRARDLPPQTLERILIRIQRSTLPPSVLPDISPTRGEIGSFDILAPSAVPAIGEIVNEGAISPLVGEMSGRTDGGNVECQHPNGGSFVNVVLTDGRCALPVALPFGHVQAIDLIDFAREIEAIGIAELRLAPERTLILLCPSEASANAAREIARHAGFIIDADDPRANIAACPGAPACASGQIPARAMAAKIAETWPGGLDLHVSGCQKRCAKPGHKGLTLLGISSGAALVLESAGPAPLAKVAKERAVAAIDRVAELVAAERKPGESEAQCLERIGKNHLAEVFVRES